MALELQQVKACDGRVEKIISFRIGEFALINDELSRCFPRILHMTDFWWE